MPFDTLPIEFGVGFTNLPSTLETRHSWCLIKPVRLLQVSSDCANLWYISIYCGGLRYSVGRFRECLSPPVWLVSAGLWNPSPTICLLSAGGTLNRVRAFEHVQKNLLIRAHYQSALLNPRSVTAARRHRNGRAICRQA